MKNDNTSILADNKMLDGYILAAEFMKIANLTPNSFRYWTNCKCASYDGSKTIFLKKETIPEKYSGLIEQANNLDGYVQSNAFCRYTGLTPSLLVMSNKSEFKFKIEILIIGRCKLVNLKKLYQLINLPSHYYIYIDKCKNFSPLEKKIPLTKSLCIGYY